MKRKEERSVACDCALCRLRAAHTELEAAQKGATRERERFERLAEEFGERKETACLPRIAHGVEAAAKWAMSETPFAARVRPLLDAANAHVSAASPVVAECDKATALLRRHAQDCRDLTRRFRRARAVVHAGRRLERLGHFAVTKAFVRQADAATELAHLQIATTLGRLRTHRRAERTLFATFKARQETTKRHVAAVERVFGAVPQRGASKAAEAGSASWEESRALHDTLARFLSDLRAATRPRADKLRRTAEERGWSELLDQLVEALGGDREKAKALLLELKRRHGTGASAAVAAVAPWRPVVETLHPTPVEEPPAPEEDAELDVEVEAAADAEIETDAEIEARIAAVVEAALGGVVEDDAVNEDKVEVEDNGVNEHTAEVEGAANDDARIAAILFGGGVMTKRATAWVDHEGNESEFIDGNCFCGFCGATLKATTDLNSCPLCGVEFLYRTDCPCNARTFWAQAASSYECARCRKKTRLVSIRKEVVGSR